MKITIIKMLALSLGALVTASLFAPPPPQGWGPGGFKHKGPRGEHTHGFGWHKGFHHRGEKFFERERATLKDLVDKIDNQNTKKELLDKLEKAKALGDDRKENQEKNRILFEEEVKYLQEVRKALGLPDLPKFSPDEMRPGMGGPRHGGHVPNR